jgi:hypothetical protein
MLFKQKPTSAKTTTITGTTLHGAIKSGDKKDYGSGTNYFVTSLNSHVQQYKQVFEINITYLSEV